MVGRDPDAPAPLAVDVLARSGIRTNHAVPRSDGVGSMSVTQLAGSGTQPADGAGDATVEDAPPAWTFTNLDDDGPSLVDATRSLVLNRQALLESRYNVAGKLGEGGMGVVWLARDRNLGRDVALKTIPPDRMNSKRLARFVSEARITAQLEHPAIVPLHDLFISGSGDVYYSMKRVQGRSLADVLDDLRSGEPAAHDRYNLVHLLGVFRTAAQAIAYAHTRRVVHRDVKPANVMLGDFGEVLVMDWGVARLLDDAPEELVSVDLEGASLMATADGAMVGSPAYMAPEQFSGTRSEVSTASDVYALGVVLYEILTLKRPFKAETVGRLLYLVAKGEFLPPSSVAPHREIPTEVEAICLKAMARDPDDRYTDAGELTKALEDWLEGVGPRQEAERLVAQGRELLLVFARRASEAEDAELRVRTLNAELRPWDPMEMKRLAWEAEKERDDRTAEMDHVFGDCEAAFESALSHVTNYHPARLGLADLYWIRFLQAEEGRDARWMRRWEELIRRWAPEGYARRLKGDGTLTVRTRPDRAKVWLAPLEEVDGRRTVGQSRKLGKSAIKRAPVAMGAYQLEVEAPDCARVRLPVVVKRVQNVELRIDLLPADTLRPGFVHVPASTVSLGGDLAALSGVPEQDVWVQDFAIATTPVTVAEYLAFLAYLTREDPELAALRSPRHRGARRARTDALFVLPDDGGHSFPFVDRAGTVWRPDQPIVSISITDARHYAEWHSDHSPGPDVRLPTEREWEKAARGADRRIFPWGDRFDASFCVMSESFPEPPDLPRIGEAEADVSPFGVRDLAGGVRDWVEWDDPDDGRPGRFPLRGGSYGTVEIYCRCASRTIVEDTYVGSHVGFRLAHDVAARESS